MLEQGSGGWRGWPRWRLTLVFDGAKGACHDLEGARGCSVVAHGPVFVESSIHFTWRLEIARSCWPRPGIRCACLSRRPLFAKPPAPTPPTATLLRPRQPKPLAQRSPRRSSPCRLLPSHLFLSHGNLRRHGTRRPTSARMHVSPSVVCRVPAFPADLTEESAKNAGHPLPLTSGPTTGTGPTSTASGSRTPSRAAL